MDGNGPGTLKARIAVAMVESIFRRAQFRVARVDRESHPGAIPTGSGYVPDFLVWRPAPGEDAELPVHRFVPIEVKYRANLGEFLQMELPAFLAAVRPEWPALHCVLVTDRPDDGRSCFQVVRAREGDGGGSPEPVDLHALEYLRVFKTTVREYEDLVRAIFPLMSAHAPSET